MLNRLTVAWALAACGVASANPLPEATSPEIEVIPFAGSDQIKHPTGLTFTRGGKLLVVESHTHFRPKNYEGPEHDQIVWLRNTDDDGKADTKSVFFETDLTATMDIAVHPESGAIYVATRNEILRLWDKNDDGIADPESVERKLVFLDTEGNYPHNGCSGLCFDDNGDLFFGIGENLGFSYTLKGSDGSSHSDHGEGGNIWHCTKDGGKLRRFATGFWNPFGVCHAPGGHVFATDNDPSSRPPSRLHYVIDGGDYGYQFRYGRGGHHPFVSWNGELPGTLPMLHGTGEAPCDVLYHRGNLIVSSWSDHRVEIYPLSWNQTHFTTNRNVLLKGGVDFRPVSFAIGPDGDLYVSDWVKKDYQLHGHGAIWRLKNWEPMESKYEVELTEEIDLEDPWTFSRSVSSPKERTARADLDLLRARFHNDPRGTQLIKEALAPEQDDKTLRLLALKWIADKQFKDFRAEVEKEIREPASVKLYHAAITARARLDDLKVTERDIQKLVQAELQNAKSPVAKRAAFLLSEDRGKMPLDQLKRLYQSDDEEIKFGVALTLQHHPDKKGARVFAREKLREGGPELVRAFLSQINPNTPEFQPKDPDALGRFLFHKSCAICHRALGYGKKGGPDLSTIGARGIDHIRKSILDPSAEIAPQFEAWEVKMKDDSLRVGFLLGEKGGRHFYSDAAGKEFTIESRDMVSRRHLPISLMPPGLNLAMSKGEFESLVNWLAGLK